MLSPFIHSPSVLPRQYLKRFSFSVNFPSRSLPILSAKANLKQKNFSSCCAHDTEKQDMPPKDFTEKGRFYSKKLLDFINYSWTPYHAVEYASRQLLEHGFVAISERDAWNLQPGGRYFFTRNNTTIVAFAVGKKYTSGNGFYMVGAHTDSPCLKLKPIATATHSGYHQLNIEPYGGGLWHTWFDRDLGLAGRVLVRQESSDSSRPDVSNAPLIRQRLVKIDRPILRIPMLAIHLQRDIGTAGFKPNPQTNLGPILASTAKAQLLGADKEGKAATESPAVKEDSLSTAPSTASPPAPVADTAVLTTGSNPAAPKGVKEDGGECPLDPPASRPSPLLTLLSKELGCSPSDVLDYELHVCDTQAGVIGGAAEEFIFCGRLDNLAMSYCSLQALLDACGTTKKEGGGEREKGEREKEEVAEKRDPLENETGVMAVALFDHEEVGSDSAQGAGGPVMRDTITRVSRALGDVEEGVVERAMLNSFLVSADMAHALHPNYADRHDPDHQPKMHAGLVVKNNVNQRYATNSASAVLFREVGRRAGLPCQEFSVRNDVPCGSTIGPILASKLGCRTVDVGIAQLSMHSIREMCGTDDVAIAYEHFCAFFRGMSKLDRDAEKEFLPPFRPRGVISDDKPCCQLH